MLTVITVILALLLPPEIANVLCVKVIAVVVVIKLAQSLWYYMAVSYTLTPQRIYVTTPWGGRSIHLSKVQSVSWSNGILWGNVVVTSGSLVGNITLSGVEAPARHADLIIQAVSLYLE